MLLKMQVEQRQIDMESSETLIEHIEIRNTDELIQRRKRDLVYEDNFNPTILEMAANRVFCYEKLKAVCGKYESPLSVQEHILHVLKERKMFLSGKVFWTMTPVLAHSRLHSTLDHNTPVMETTNTKESTVRLVS